MATESESCWPAKANTSSELSLKNENSPKLLPSKIKFCGSSGRRDTQPLCQSRSVATWHSSGWPHATNGTFGSTVVQSIRQSAITGSLVRRCWSLSIKWSRETWTWTSWTLTCTQERHTRCSTSSSDRSSRFVPGKWEGAVLSYSF